MNPPVSAHSAVPGGCFIRMLVPGVLLLVVLFVAGICCGSSQVSATDVLDVLGGGGSLLAREVVLHLRLPRVLMAINAGAVLALGGLVFQTVFRNPLAEPYILGISSGAAVGVAGGILLGLPLLHGSIFAFAGGMGVLALVYILGKHRNALGLLLSGVMINSFCGAFVLFMVSIAQSSDISSILFWFMGYLGACSLAQSIAYSLVLLPGYALLLLFAHRMNLLQLGDAQAETLGVPVKSVTLFLLVIVSVMVSALVAAVGPLGFIGLVVPQSLRLLFGQDNRLLGVACVLYGASFLVGCDLLARALPIDGEMPSGVITALIGAPIFVILLRKMQ